MIAVDGGLALVPPRRLICGSIDAFFDLHPGDWPLVADGDVVARQLPLAERLRDARTTVTAGIADGDAHGVPGARWTPGPGRRSQAGEAEPSGELLFRSGGRWRVASGEHAEALEAPFGGTVHDVQPGIGLRLRSEAQGLLGAETLAGPTSGRLAIVTGADGEVRAPHVDVSAAGAILVAGARIDAEALTRARAVGVRGIVVAGLGVKERRDFLASERRGRAAVHGLPPFAILILDGAAGRPIASPVMDVLRALEGRTVAIVGDPSCLVVDDATVELPRPPADLVWVRSGPLVGAEGRWAGLAGPRRFPGGIVLEAGFVRFGDRPPVAVPLGDLERFV
jgi:hypothetical protein